MRKEEPCRWKHRQTPMETMAKRERGHRRKMSSYSETDKGNKKDVRDLRDVFAAADMNCEILLSTLPCSASESCRATASSQERWSSHGKQQAQPSVAAVVRGPLCKSTEGDTRHLCLLSQQTRLWAPTWHKGPSEEH